MEILFVLFKQKLIQNQLRPEFQNEDSSAQGNVLIQSSETLYSF